MNRSQKRAFGKSAQCMARNTQIPGGCLMKVPEAILQGFAKAKYGAKVASDGRLYPIGEPAAL